MGSYAAGKAWKMAKEQRILETGFSLFAERGIERVTMPEIAEASNVSRATLYRYFPTKLDLVVAVSSWKWGEYIKGQNHSMTGEKLGRITAAEQMRVYLDSFLDLYRRHSDILRFNYNFNSYMQFEAGTPEQTQPFMRVVDNLSGMFHEVYERGKKDGTLRMDIPEEAMFSGTLHIMLAAATRYAVGLLYISERAANPEEELIMLEELLLSRIVRE